MFIGKFDKFFASYIDKFLYVNSDLKALADIYGIYQGFFFGVYEKTQGAKNSNSRKMDQKLKDFFPENSRIRKF